MPSNEGGLLNIPPLISNVLTADAPLVVDSEGVWLIDSAGRRYLDGCSGAVVSAIGHAHPHVVATIRAQAAKVTFAHRGAFASEAAIRLADRLCSATDLAGAWFVNSGSEAMEAAIQFALQYYREIGETDRCWFLSFGQGYHGNTLGGLSLSGHGRRAVVGRLAYDFPTLPTPYAYRDRGTLTESEYVERMLRDARSAVEASATRLAGVVFEPVGGATLGVTVPPDGYLQGLEALCREFGILLIADEVMTGLGRTGRTLAVEHWGLRPDIVAVGKSLGAGYTPIAATLLNSRVVSAIADGSGRVLGGHTYAGNPLSVAVADAVLDVIEREGLVEKARVHGEDLGRRLGELKSDNPYLVDVRGLGMFWALEFRGDPAAPGDFAKAVAFAAMERGLMVYATTGGFNDAVVVAPPLTISPREMDTLVDLLHLALRDAAEATLELAES